MTKKTRIVLFIFISAVIGAIALAASIVMFTAANQASLKKTVTNTLNSYATNKNIFKENQLVYLNEDFWPPNPFGDESLSGVYQLTGADIAILKDEEHILDCTATNKCVRVNEVISRPEKNTYCEYGEVRSGEFTMSLCINSETKQAAWQYSLY